MPGEFKIEITALNKPWLEKEYANTKKNHIMGGASADGWTE